MRVTSILLHTLSSHYKSIKLMKSITRSVRLGLIGLQKFVKLTRFYIYIYVYIRPTENFCFLIKETLIIYVCVLLIYDVDFSYILSFPNFLCRSFLSVTISTKIGFYLLKENSRKFSGRLNIIINISIHRHVCARIYETYIV